MNLWDKKKKKKLRLAIGCWLSKIIPSHLKSNTELSCQLRKTEIVGVAAVVWAWSLAFRKRFGDYCFGCILKNG